jgi:hypothetical protein
MQFKTSTFFDECITQLPFSVMLFVNRSTIAEKTNIQLSTLPFERTLIMLHPVQFTQPLVNNHQVDVNDVYNCEFVDCAGIKCSSKDYGTMETACGRGGFGDLVCSDVYIVPYEVSFGDEGESEQVCSVKPVLSLIPPGIELSGEIFANAISYENAVQFLHSSLGGY